MRARPGGAGLLFALGLLGLLGGIPDADGGTALQTPTWASHRVLADTTLVTMTNDLDFVSDTVRVAVGDTVVWRNESDLVHTVTADPDRAARGSSVRLPPGAEPFDSGSVPPGATWSRPFPVAGTYRYFCVPHEAAGMIGVVIVGEEG